MPERPKPGVLESRRRVEEGLSEVRLALRRTTGRELRGRTWVLPLLAAAAGLTFALLVRRRRDRH